MKTKKIIILTTIVALVEFSGCSRFKGTIKQYDSDERTVGWNAEPEKSLKLTILWVKNKRNAVDVSYSVMNGYSHPVTIRANSVRVKVRNQEGDLVESNPHWVISPGEAKAAIAYFEFKPKIEMNSTLFLGIENIYKGAFEQLAPIVVDFKTKFSQADVHKQPPAISTQEKNKQVEEILNPVLVQIEMNGRLKALLKSYDKTHEQGNVHDTSTKEEQDFGLSSEKKNTR